MLSDQRLHRQAPAALGGTWVIPRPAEGHVTCSSGMPGILDDSVCLRSSLKRVGSSEPVDGGRQPLSTDPSSFYVDSAYQISSGALNVTIRLRSRSSELSHPQALFPVVIPHGICFAAAPTRSLRGKLFNRLLTTGRSSTDTSPDGS